MFYFITSLVAVLPICGTRFTSSKPLCYPSPFLLLCTFQLWLLVFYFGF